MIEPVITLEYYFNPNSDIPFYFDVSDYKLDEYKEKLSDKYKIEFAEYMYDRYDDKLREEINDLYGFSDDRDITEDNTEAMEFAKDLLEDVSNDFDFAKAFEEELEIYFKDDAWDMYKELN